MTTITEKLSNGNEIAYQVTELGTYYHAQTNNRIVEVLELARINHKRIKVYYGDVETGRDWCEENDTVGYVGRSTGRIKIPLLVHNERSMGGGGILDNCIVKIKEANGGYMLYQADNYQAPNVAIKESSDIEGYTHETWVNGKLYGRHKSLKSAQLLKNKLS